MLTTQQQYLVYTNFLSSLLNAQTHRPSSLPFIINQLPSEPVVNAGEPFQAISIGGTNYKSALFNLGHDGQLIMYDREASQRPYFNNRDDVLGFIQGLVDPSIEYIAINFASPLKPEFRNGLLDGRLFKATKFDRFEGLIDYPLGQTIEEFFGHSVKVTVANDTICLLLAGITKYQRTQLGAGIVGTGYNTAFFLDDEHAINVESGSFNEFEKSVTGKKVFKKALHKNNEFEKEVSGGYVYQHFNETPGISAPINSSEELDAIARDENHPDVRVARDLLEYSAQLVAAQIAGISTFCHRDLHFVMEGSLFWKAWEYKNMVEKWVERIETGHSVDFFQVEDSELWGAAHLLV